MPTPFTHTIFGIILYLLFDQYFGISIIFYLIFANIADISVLDKERGTIFRITHDLLFILAVMGLPLLMTGHAFFAVGLICMLCHFVLDFLTKGFLYVYGETIHTTNLGFRALNDYSKFRIKGYPIEIEIFSAITFLIFYILI